MQQDSINTVCFARPDAAYRCQKKTISAGCDRQGVNIIHKFTHMQQQQKHLLQTISSVLYNSADDIHGNLYRD